VPFTGTALVQDRFPVRPLDLLPSSSGNGEEGRTNDLSVEQRRRDWSYLTAGDAIGESVTVKEVVEGSRPETAGKMKTA
jgi:hypothetical protein